MRIVLFITNCFFSILQKSHFSGKATAIYLAVVFVFVSILKQLHSIILKIQTSNGK